MTPPRLTDCVTVRGRFHRSVHLVRDWEATHAQAEGAGGSLHDYLLTPTGRNLALALLEALEQPGSGRAWSLVGPYGTGKSAFVLFLTDLLSNEPPTHPDAAALRAHTAPPRLYPILLVGQRASLPHALGQALAQRLAPLDPDWAAAVQARMAQPDAAGEVARWIEEAIQRVQSHGYHGLLLVVDEFGKFLEQAALHPAGQDVFVMQQVAELAVRSPQPLLLLTVQHTATAEYLHATTALQRDEWQKVQGRFASFAFHEAPQQMLRLIGAALRMEAGPEVMAAYAARVRRITKAAALAESHQRFDLEAVALACVPLHPLAALLLWAIFRSKLAQNERSLFAFLTAQEPFGFPAFLAATPCDTEAALYPPERLYDYVTTALGGAVYLGDHSYHWRELEQNLQRLPYDAPALAAPLLKLVGLVGMYGAPSGLLATVEMLALALDQHERAEVDEVLDYLAEQQLIVYRRLTQSYALWEGAHVDLEAYAAQAQQHIGLESLAARLRPLVPLRPLVARAHYIKTGTLRFFTASYLDAAEAQPPPPLDKEGDGSICYLLTTDTEVRERLLAAYLAHPSAAGMQIWAFPPPLRHVELPLREAEMWQWVQENVPALAGDEGARKEVAIRLHLAKERLAEAVRQSLDPTVVTWVQGGQERPIASARAFTRWLSELCDGAFERCPPLKNELLNRAKLSSAAVAARRALLEAMVTRPRQERLGIERTPPELSMYRSLLEQGGFHAEQAEGWGFGSPQGSWLPIWEEIERFLAETHAARRPLRALYERLQQPPYGLREGPLPVLVAAALLAGGQTIALYEDGLFVPELRIEVLERLTRNVDAFELQRYAFSSDEQTLLQEIRQGLGGVAATGEESVLLEVVRGLVVAAARLPAYAKQTRDLAEPHAAQVRDVLLKASDPYRLLFHELPAALKLEPASPDFAAALHRCLLALHNAYPRLLDRIEESLRVAFRLPATADEAVAALRTRAAPMQRYVTEQPLTLFVKEASQLGPERDWREVLARALSRGKSPLSWNDAEVVTFQAVARRVASDFVRLEALVLERDKAGISQVLRVGILQAHLEEAHTVVSVTPEQAAAVQALVARLQSVMDAQPDDLSSDEAKAIRVAALAEIAVALLRQNGYHT